MFYVYILKSQKYNWKYIGSCVDLRKRFLEHNSGKVRSTKARKPYNLVYYEAYNNKAVALKREIELKHNSSKKEELFKRIFEN
ncbi:MAG: GIY-YIG nuclease family protein [Candidatus Azambacteria bacterium]|nr:GIY-YIG nuclease family protein [Candidatus Azambacteria bacterium]